MFVDQRTLADTHRRAVQELVADLNRRLRRGRNQRTRESVYAEVANKLASLSLLSVFAIDLAEVEDDAGKHLEVHLRFDEQAWARRRRYDGFVLLVAHPALAHSGVELVQLYRAKDMVEKDFQTIKSDLKLRPVFHYTDPKVRAHVTLCMLALLLERTLEARLRHAGQPRTAPACFEELAVGHLNLLATDPDAPPAYVLTEPTSTQRVLLAHLRMTHLADQEQLTERLHPRHVD